MSEVITKTSFDESQGKIIVQQTQDVEPFLEFTKANSEAANAKFAPSRDIRHAGVLPLVFLEGWLKQQGMTFREFMLDRGAMRKLLNDPDLSKLRVWKGRV